MFTSYKHSLTYKIIGSALHMAEAKFEWTDYNVFLRNCTLQLGSRKYTVLLIKIPAARRYLTGEGKNVTEKASDENVNDKFISYVDEKCDFICKRRVRI